MHRRLVGEASLRRGLEEILKLVEVVFGKYSDLPTTRGLNWIRSRHRLRRDHRAVGATRCR
jgi:hypothetical protein